MINHDGGNKRKTKLMRNRMKKGTSLSWVFSLAVRDSIRLRRALTIFVSPKLWESRKPRSCYPRIKLTRWGSIFCFIKQDWELKDRIFDIASNDLRYNLLGPRHEKATHRYWRCWIVLLFQYYCCALTERWFSNLTFLKAIMFQNKNSTTYYERKN